MANVSVCCVLACGEVLVCVCVCCVLACGSCACVYACVCACCMLAVMSVVSALINTDEKAHRQSSGAEWACVARPQ